jgi:hypothetical protein
MMTGRMHATFRFRVTDAQAAPVVYLAADGKPTRNVWGNVGRDGAPEPRKAERVELMLYDADVIVTVDLDALLRLARKAAENKSRKARDGALVAVASPRGQVRALIIPRDASRPAVAVAVDPA